jgi:tetratricopeptide (TPR) repeat protein
VKTELLKQSIAFNERILEQAPRDANARRETARLCQQLADFAFLGGEDGKAACRRSISILEGLVTDFPQDATNRDLLVASHKSMAGLCWAELRWGESVLHYQAAHKLIEGLAEQFANDAKYREGLVVSHGQLAYPLEESGEMDDAEWHYRAALPDRTISGAMARQRFAKLLMSTNRFVDAKQQLDDALKIAGEHVSESEWGSALKAFWTAAILNETGKHAIGVHQPDLARAYLNRSKDVCLELSKRQGHSFFQSNTLGWTYHFLSESFIQSGQLTDADEAERQALETWQTARGRMGSHNVALANIRLGEMLQLAGRNEEASSCFGLAKEQLEEISRELPDEAYCQLRMILFLANCSDPSFRDPQQAVTLAKRIIRESDGPTWRYLALSQYRVGTWQDAMDSIQTSMKLRVGGDAWDWYLLAMIYWKLGQQAEARQWYARAEAAVSSAAAVLYDDIGVMGFQRMRAEAQKLIRPTPPSE